MTRSVLIVAPHPDDEILGCGGAISYFKHLGFRVYVLIVAAHMPPLYSQEVHSRCKQEATESHELLGIDGSIFLDYPAVLVADIPTAEFNKSISDVIVDIDPYIVLMPFYDRHIDHRVVFDACMVASRPIKSDAKLSLVACYETISESFWNAPSIEPQFIPNWFIDITGHIELKCRAMSCYKSQVSTFPGPRSIEALRSLALFRGSQHGFKYAEEFQIVRMHNFVSIS